jgi:hypothetical protein
MSGRGGGHPVNDLCEGLRRPPNQSTKSRHGQASCFRLPRLFQPPAPSVPAHASPSIFFNPFNTLQNRHITYITLNPLTPLRYYPAPPPRALRPANPPSPPQSRIPQHPPASPPPLSTDTGGSQNLKSCADCIDRGGEESHVSGFHFRLSPAQSTPPPPQLRSHASHPRRSPRPAPTTTTVATVHPPSTKPPARPTAGNPVRGFALTNIPPSPARPTAGNPVRGFALTNIPPSPARPTAGNPVRGFALTNIPPSPARHPARHRANHKQKCQLLVKSWHFAIQSITRFFSPLRHFRPVRPKIHSYKTPTFITFRHIFSPARSPSTRRLGGRASSRRDPQHPPRPPGRRSRDRPGCRWLPATASSHFPMSAFRPLLRASVRSWAVSHPPANPPVPISLDTARDPCHHKPRPVQTPTNKASAPTTRPQIRTLPPPPTPRLAQVGRARAFSPVNPARQLPKNPRPLLPCAL